MSGPIATRPDETRRDVLMEPINISEGQDATASPSHQPAMKRSDIPFLEGVFDVIDQGLIVLDAARRIRRWNRWMTTRTGLPSETVEGRALDDVFPGLTNARLRGAVSDAIASGVSSVLTHSLHRALFPLKISDGREMIHDVAVRQIAYDPVLCLIQISDVTVATDRDQMLRERQNARYNAVVASAPDAILTISSDGVVQMANPAAGRQFGYLARDLIGRPISTLLLDQEQWDANWTEVLAGSPPKRPVELRARRRDGSPTYLEVSAAAWQTDQRMFVTAILRDVNERRAAEDALRRLNQTLEQRVAERTADRDRMWRLSTDVMVLARPDRTITSANPAWQSVLGWNEAELIGARLRDFVVDDDQALLRSVLDNMDQGQTTRLFELRLKTHDGGTRQIAWNAVVADGMFQAVGRDITAEREAQSALAKSEEALRQSQKMESLGQLTGGIAHDFNNLLTGIIGAMNVVKRRIAAGRLNDVERFLDAASASAYRAAALTHRLLAFARRQPLDPRPVDVNQLILGMEDLLRRSVGEQVTLEFILAPEQWPATTDANQLENALLNLVINSRDAMPDGGRIVIETAGTTVTGRELSSPYEIEPGDYTVIRVTDSGVGMSPDTLAKVFDPFFTTKPIGQGTGLGLSMVYGFAKQSRGHIQIDSEPGNGTTVRLYLPRHQQVEAYRPAAIARGEMPHGDGETVLLVEDDPAVRLLLAEVLVELGYASIEAADAEAALPLLASNQRLDLMITDVGLPGLSGRQLADLAREHRPELKVLFVTGYAEHAAKRADFLAPGMEMVTKPFSLDEVAVTIRDMIAKADDHE
jgi:PAS domain S-box-containing protein